MSVYQLNVIQTACAGSEPTSLSQSAWEADLLSLAFSGAATKCSTSVGLAKGAAHLQAAYRYCEELTAHHSRSFHMASGFLPPAQRQACRALYAFCRVSDDIVDHPPANPEEALAIWRNLSLGAQTASHHPVALAFQDTRHRYQIPDGYANQLIDGVAVDLRPRRYQTFTELSRYCYGVASTVGLMSMRIIGYAGAQALPYALKLGIALQMTNILRDVGEDWRAGRVYLPQEELHHFGIHLAEIAQKGVGERWREFMRFQIRRTRQLYAEAKPGIALLDPSGRFAIAAAAELYGAILDQIEKLDYDVFTQRAHVGAIKKIGHLLGIWVAL